MGAVMGALNAALGFVYDNILSIAMMALMIAGGAYLTYRTRAFQFRKFGCVMKSTIGGVFDKKTHEKSANGVSPFQAVTTALAGTIGTGSIAGLATALVSGGPGAIFWMWVSALLGMVPRANHWRHVCRRPDVLYQKRSWHQVAGGCFCRVCYDCLYRNGKCNPVEFHLRRYEQQLRRCSLDHGTDPHGGCRRGYPWRREAHCLGKGRF